PPDNADIVAPPYLDSAKYWGAAPSGQSGGSEPPLTYGLYLSPVPPASGWDTVPSSPPNGAPVESQKPPPPTPSTAAPPMSREPAPMAEAAQAQQARDAAARRFSPGEQAAVARAASSASEPEPDTGEPSLQERMRLHRQDSYYRGTLFGGFRLLS